MNDEVAFPALQLGWEVRTVERVTPMITKSRLALILSLLLFAPAVGRSQTAQTREPVAFFYTAVWDSALNDIVPSTLQRFRITEAEYQEAKSRFITAFIAAATAAAAAPAPAAPAAPGVPGEPAAGRTQVMFSLDPRVQPGNAPMVLEFDQASMQAAVAAGNLPETLAEWTFYYWQVLLWEHYISERTLMLPGLLTLTNVEEFSGIISKMREPIWVWTEIDPADNEPTEWVQALHEFPAIAEPTESELTAIEFLRLQAETLDGMVVAPQLPIAAAEESEGMMRVYKEAAYAIDAKKHDQYWAIMNQIRQRQEKRDQYAEWIEDRKGMLQEFAQDWARKYDGSQINVDGVQFLVSEKEPIDGVPANARSIVVDQTIVPYDLLNEDGTLKRPVPQED